MMELSLKDIIKQDVCLRYVAEQMNVYSSPGQKYLYALPFSTHKAYLEQEYAITRQAIATLQNASVADSVRELSHQLMLLQNVEATLKHVQEHYTADDVELYEIKHFALISERVRMLMQTLQWVELPILEPVVELLDPEGLRVDTFYIYDAYSEPLAALRKQAKAYEEVPAELAYSISEAEDEIRRSLSAQLQPYADSMLQALHTLAYTDVLQAKASMAISMGLCCPTLSDNATCYKGLFNPQIRTVLQQQNREYQPVDVQYDNAPTLVTGINMGGKTVLLKTLALSQYMCQLGFFVPAAAAQIHPVEQVMVSIDDEQNHLEGLSSFAAEMKRMNDIIHAVTHTSQVLVLIDELARTTNPQEGRAIVSAMAEYMLKYKVAAFITTHYDGVDVPCNKLRIKGLKENVNMQSGDWQQYIDYSLVSNTEGNVPKEALKIAEMMGVDKDFIALAHQKMQ